MASLQYMSAIAWQVLGMLVVWFVLDALNALAGRPLNRASAALARHPRLALALAVGVVGLLLAFALNGCALDLKVTQ